MSFKSGDKVWHKIHGLGTLIRPTTASTGDPSWEVILPDSGGVVTWFNRNIINIAEISRLERAIYDIPEDV